MAKIPFDIKYRPQIESGEYKVETRSGKTAKIVYWDKVGNQLVVLVGKDEDVLTYNSNRTTGQQMPLPSDLFVITPEEELTPFEQEVSDIVEYCKKHGAQVALSYAKRHAKTLLNFAREELVGEMLTSDPKESALYKVGVLDGKAEALKDLPRWRKWEYGAAGNNDGHQIALVSGACGMRFTSVLSITGEKYIMLDDLKKLPGFKEN